MKRTISQSTSRFGDFTITSLGPTAITGSRRQVVNLVKSRYTWRPPEILSRQLPPDFTVEIDCCVAEDGLRRFVPSNGTEQLIHEAFLAGLAILDHERRLDADHRYSYRLMHLLFQLSRRMQEHLNRRFRSADSLFVPKKVRGGNLGHSLLPPGIGFNAAESGRTCSPSELIRRGREAAIRAGCRAVDEAVAVQYGLREAVRRRPLELRDGKERALIHMALFDNSGLEKPPAGVGTIVTDRLGKLLDAHLADERAPFSNWFFPGKGNLVKALAGGPRSPGGRLATDHVRHVLLDLGRQSYQYVADCHQMFWQWFRLALEKPLNPVEFHLFDKMYRPQSYFGDLPLLLLAERCGLISTIIAEIWENSSDPQLVGVMHRLLDIYAQMAPERREVDRLLKAKSKAGAELTNSDWAAACAADDSRGTFEAIAELIAKERQFRCDYCDAQWTARVDSLVPPGPADLIVLELSCTCRRVAKMVAISQSDFRRLAAPVVRRVPRK